MLRDYRNPLLTKSMNLLIFDAASAHNATPMHPWLALVLTLCAVALTLVLVPAILAVRRTAERAERVLAVAEHDLGPLLTQIQAMAEDLQQTSKEARSELARMGALAERIEDLADGVSRVVTALAALTRAGQLVGVAAGLKTGFDAFLHRFRKPSGDNDE